MKRIHWQELIVPAIILVFLIAYWVQVKGQGLAVIIIPYGTILMILAVMGLVLYAHAWSPDKTPDSSRKTAFSGSFLVTFRTHVREIGIFVLSIVYYFAFDPIGFTTSNLLFLIAAFRIAGLSIWRSIIYGLLTTVAIYAVSEVLQMNAPQFPWFLR